MHGIATLVELLLVFLILIILATLLWFFTSGTINALTRSGTGETEKTREILSSCMIVDSVYENKVYVKNCGDGIITNNSLSVYLDDEPLEFVMTPETVKKGEIGTITADLSGASLGDHDLKISNPNLQIVQKVEAVLSGGATVLKMK